MKGEDRDLKDRLLRRFGSHIGTLKLEFSKKKKKGKLPREARQALLEWWNVHYKWPYPTVNFFLISISINHTLLISILMMYDSKQVFGCSYKFLLDYFLSIEPHLNKCAVVTFSSVILMLLLLQYCSSFLCRELVQENFAFQHSVTFRMSKITLTF